MTRHEQKAQGKRKFASKSEEFRITHQQRPRKEVDEYIERLNEDFDDDLSDTSKPE